MDRNELVPALIALPILSALVGGAFYAALFRFRHPRTWRNAMEWGRNPVLTFFLGSQTLFGRDKREHALGDVLGLGLVLVFLLVSFLLLLGQLVREEIS
jgi:hypothetical protein